jgi:hypothetical protein
MMLTLYPQLERELESLEKRQQLIFVVDVSGSMEGEKIDYVRKALKLRLYSFCIFVYIYSELFIYSCKPQIKCHPILTR